MIDAEALVRIHNERKKAEEAPAPVPAEQPPQPANQYPLAPKK